MAPIGPCICCGRPGSASILLAWSVAPDHSVRLFLPNQGFRDPQLDPSLDTRRETPFCHECMRAVEDSVRATIQYRRSEANLGPISG